MYTALICILAIPGLLLVMDEGLYFPVSNFCGLLLVLGACLLGRHLRRTRRWR